MHVCLVSWSVMSTKMHIFFVTVNTHTQQIKSKLGNWNYFGSGISTNTMHLLNRRQDEMHLVKGT